MNYTMAKIRTPFKQYKARKLDIKISDELRNYISEFLRR